MKPNFTSNAALAAATLTGSILPGYQADRHEHGRITTCNDSHFTEAHFNRPMTDYAVGWADPAGYDALVEFLAPQFQAPADLFTHATFPNAEAFLSDGAADDLRAIGADFKSVDYSEGKAAKQVANRGLRIELDYDKIKTKPNWQRLYTARLLERLKRNQWRRAVALGVASGTADSLAWAGAAQPDIALNAQIISCADSSGIKPNRMLVGEQAWQYRLANYGGQENAGATAALGRNVAQLGQFLGIETMEDSSRYQNGASKASILGAKIILFNGRPGVMEEDPTNFKLAWVPCEGGTRYRVYVRQLTVKKWEIVVEHYEKLFATTTLGCRVVTITN